MLKNLQKKIKKNFEISGLIILIFFTATFTSYFNYKKNLNDKTYSNFIDNIYFKKTLSHLINNLEPKYQKIKHKIRELLNSNLTAVVITEAFRSYDISGIAENRCMAEVKQYNPIQVKMGGIIPVF